MAGSLLSSSIFGYFEENGHKTSLFGLPRQDMRRRRPGVRYRRPIAVLWAPDRGCYCAQHGSNARFKSNVRFRQQVIRRLPQLPAAGFACPAAAPLGATHSAPSVGAYKTGIIPQMRRRNQALICRA